jgi:two-component system response regulator RpfG
MPTVLILDDQSISRMILEELIHSIDEGLRVESFAEPVAALEWAKNNTIDLVITDFKMPNMDGVEFTHWLRQIPSSIDVPVVIITCVDDKSVRYKALEAGATDFLSKPIDHYECRARCRNLLQLRQQQVIIKDRAHWLEQEVFAKTHELELREQETLLRLAKAGEYRDEETGNHVVRMAEYAYLIANELGLEEDTCMAIRHAAQMHDIGKIGVPDHVLLKPGKLTPDEWQLMQTHTRIGYEILRDSPSYYLQTGAVIALGHHERYDGGGYPDRIAGNDIPIEARVAAVADVFDALQSERPYKKGWPMDRTLEYMRCQRGLHFDPDCIDAFFVRMEQIMAIKNRFADDTSLVNLQ